MAFELLPDALRNEIQPLLPPEPPKPKGGRPRMPDRTCLTGIVCVLRIGMPWRMVPAELGCGSGLGRFRYVVERTLAWFGHCRRLKLCHEKDGSYFQAFHDLAAVLICPRKRGYLTGVLKQRLSGRSPTTAMRWRLT